MNFRRVPSYLLALTLVIAACGRIEAVPSSEPRPRSTLPPSTSIADSTPISDLTPETGWYRLRYSADVAPLIVHCMNDSGWEATYDPELGALLPQIPVSQGMERDGVMSLCVASSHTHRGIYID